VIGALGRLRGDEDGVTLVELVVVTSLLTVLLGFVLAGLSSLQRASAGAGLRLENLEQARTIVDQMAKDIRTAAKLADDQAPFLVADQSTMTFYANVNLSTSCPKKIRLYVDGSNRLIEETTPPNAGGVPPSCAYTGSATSRVVGTYIANTASQPMFTYWYDNAGTPAAFTTAQVPLSAANMLLVNAVGIQVSIRKATNFSVPASTVLNRVRLANVNYNPPPT
jgi:type II secretory pathway pseudopilin PulG